MDNVSYLLLNKELYQMDHLEILANNLAHIDSGFKQDFLISGQKKLADGNNEVNFVKERVTSPDWSQGSMKITNRDLDIAINGCNEGAGFFMVSTPLGRRYTRNGHFFVDTENRLVDAKRNPVLSTDGQEIIFEAEDDSPTILSDGRIIVNNQERGSIGVMSFNKEELKMVNKNMDGYFSTEIEGVIADNPGLIQGTLEESNSNNIVNLSAIRMIEREMGLLATLASQHDAMRKNAYKIIAHQ